MKAAILFVGAALCLASFQPAMAATGALAAPAGRMTIEDMLRAESLGDAWFSPDGGHLLFSRDRPVTEVTERAVGEEALGRSRLYVADAAGGAPRLVGAGLAPIHFQPWSPDGRGALTIQAGGGLYRLAYWDMASGEVRVLPGLPTFSYPTFAWAGGRLAYATVPEDGVQPWVGEQMLKRLDTAWRKSWTADEPQVTAFSANPVFKPSTPGSGALMLADLATGEGRKIADGDYQLLKTSPDGRWLAAVRLAEPLKDAVAWQFRRGELQIFQLTADGAVLAHTYPELDLDIRDLAWSATGDRLVIGGKAVGAARADSGVYQIDAGSGEARALPSRGLRLLDPSVLAGTTILPVGWIGDRPVAIAGRPGKAAPAAAKPGAAIDYGETSDLRFDLYDLSGPQPRNLTGFAKASVDDFLAPAGQAGAMVVADGALWRVGVSEPRRLSPPGLGAVAGFALGQAYFSLTTTAYARDSRGERVALLIGQPSGGAQRQVIDLETGKVLSRLPDRAFLAASPDLMSVVTRAEDRWATSYSVITPAGEHPLASVNAALAARPVAPATRFTYDYKGQTLTGWVVTPPGAKPGVALPTIVSVYGGVVYGAEVPNSAKPSADAPQFSVQLLAAQGYAVILPSTPLGAGADTDVMGTLAEECISAIDALAAKGVVDPKRVGVIGQSFGGFSAAAILARRSDRFRAGVAMAGIYDWSAAYGEPALSDMLGRDGRDHMIVTKMVEDGQIRLGAPPWKSREAYLRNSPISEVEKIDSPLLLLHGDLDVGGDGLAGAMRMYYALVRAGKHPALVHYWGEGHVAESAWAMRDQFARITAWFDAYVKGDGSAPPPGG